MLSKTGYIVSAALFLIWVAFVFGADQTIVRILNAGIAGWVIGNWIFEFAYHYFPKDDESDA